MPGCPPIVVGMPSSDNEDQKLLTDEEMAAGKVAALDAKDKAAALAKDIASGKAKEEIMASKARCQEFFGHFQDAPPEGKLTMAIAVCLKYFVVPLLYLGKCYFQLMKICYRVYIMLPMNLISLIFGIGLCFFGGTYFATIAAAEAFRQFGGEMLMEELRICWDESQLAAAAIEEDNKVDDNKDGVADVDVLDGTERLKRATMVGMMNVKDPMRFQKALFFLYTTWMSVLATLKFQFAKTVTLCLAVSEMLEMPACRVLGPVVALALGPKLNHWCYAIISCTMKIFAVFIAAYVQAIISAFYSGIRGGKMFAEGVFNILGQYGIMKKLPDWAVAKDTEGNFDPNASSWDECVAYPLAAAGFYWQFTSNFALPFPWNLILLPLTIVEYIIQWNVFT